MSFPAPDVMTPRVLHRALNYVRTAAAVVSSHRLANEAKLANFHFLCQTETYTNSSAERGGVNSCSDTEEKLESYGHISGSSDRSALSASPKRI